MRYQEFITEYDRSREQQRIEALPAYQARLKQDPEFSLERLESADPTAQKIYVPRLAQWWLAGEPIEDLISTSADALEKYHTLKVKKKLSPEHLDIGRFRTADQFLAVMDQYQLPGAAQSEDRGQFKQIYRDPELIVVQLGDKTAAQWWGQGTKWCTAAKKNNRFSRYASQGPIYVIIDRVANAKYQYWWDKNDVYDMQFMDAQDRGYDPGNLKSFAKLQSVFRPLTDHIMWNPNPTESEQLAAVRQDSQAIRWTQEAVQLAAVQQDAYIIQYIPNPSETVQLAAVQQDGWAIRYIKNPSKAVKLAAVRRYGLAIGWIRYPSEAVQLAAVQQDGLNIQWIRKNPSEAVKLTAVKQNGEAIQHIPTPSEAVQLAAVQQDGEAIRWIQNPSEAVQLAAVQRNRRAIRWIKNPTPKVRALNRKLNRELSS